MKNFILFTVGILVLFPGSGFPIYRIDYAYDYAVQWCNDFNVPPYCNLETLPDGSDCANFLSQILQNGCMGVCGNWNCGEELDPAADEN